MVSDIKSEVDSKLDLDPPATLQKNENSDLNGVDGVVEELTKPFDEKNDVKANEEEEIVTKKPENNNENSDKDKVVTEPSDSKEITIKEEEDKAITMNENETETTLAVLDSVNEQEVKADKEIENEIKVESMEEEVEIKEKGVEMKEEEANIKEKEVEMKEEEVEVKEKEVEIKEKEIEIKEEEANIKEKEVKIKEKEVEIKEKEIENKEEEVKTKEEEVKIKEEEVKIKEKEVKIKEKEVEIKEEVVASIEKVQKNEEPISLKKLIEPPIIQKPKSDKPVSKNILIHNNFGQPVVVDVAKLTCDNEEILDLIHTKRPEIDEDRNGDDLLEKSSFDPALKCLYYDLDDNSTSSSVGKNSNEYDSNSEICDEDSFNGDEDKVLDDDDSDVALVLDSSDEDQRTPIVRFHDDNFDDDDDDDDYSDSELMKKIVAKNKSIEEIINDTDDGADVVEDYEDLDEHDEEDEDDDDDDGQIIEDDDDDDDDDGNNIEDGMEDEEIEEDEEDDDDGADVEGIDYDETDDIIDGDMESQDNILKRKRSRSESLSPVNDSQSQSKIPKNQIGINSEGNNKLNEGFNKTPTTDTSIDINLSSPKGDCESYITITLTTPETGTETETETETETPNVTKSITSPSSSSSVTTTSTAISVPTTRTNISTPSDTFASPPIFKSISSSSSLFSTPTSSSVSLGSSTPTSSNSDSSVIGVIPSPSEPIKTTPSTTLTALPQKLSISEFGLTTLKPTHLSNADDHASDLSFKMTPEIYKMIKMDKLEPSFYKNVLDIAQKTSQSMEANKDNLQIDTSESSEQGDKSTSSFNCSERANKKEQNDLKDKSIDELKKKSPTPTDGENADKTLEPSVVANDKISMSVDEDVEDYDDNNEEAEAEAEIDDDENENEDDETEIANKAEIEKSKAAKQGNDKTVVPNTNVQDADNNNKEQTSNDLNNLGEINSAQSNSTNAAVKRRLSPDENDVSTTKKTKCTKNDEENNVVVPPRKKLCSDLQSNFSMHDRILTEYIEKTSNDNMDSIQIHLNQLAVEIQTLNDMIKNKEIEWNHMLHLKKVKEEICQRLTRRKDAIEIATHKVGEGSNSNSNSNSIDFDKDDTISSPINDFQQNARNSFHLRKDTSTPIGPSYSQQSTADVDFNFQTNSNGASVLSNVNTTAASILQSRANMKSSDLEKEKPITERLHRFLVSRNILPKPSSEKLHQDDTLLSTSVHGIQTSAAQSNPFKRHKVSLSSMSAAATNAATNLASRNLTNSLLNNSKKNQQPILNNYLQAAANVEQQLGEMLNGHHESSRGHQNGYQPVMVGRQGAFKDVKSIIAEFRQSHPETVPRRGRRIKPNSYINDSNINMKSDTNSRPSSNDSSSHSLNNVSTGCNLVNVSFKDVLVQFANNMESENLPSGSRGSVGVQPYPEVTLHPVSTSQSSHGGGDQSSGSLLHGILTKNLQHRIPETTSSSNRKSNSSSSHSANYSNFSPTLARLLTAPERITTSSGGGGSGSGGGGGNNNSRSTHDTIAANVASLQAMHNAISATNKMNLAKVVGNNSEITITPVMSAMQAQFQNQQSLLQQQLQQKQLKVLQRVAASVASDHSKTENYLNMDYDADNSVDRLIIDESVDDSNHRMAANSIGQEFNENDVPVCQGCKKNEAQFVCAGCARQWYCSRECQVSSWDSHSDVCTAGIELYNFFLMKSRGINIFNPNMKIDDKQINHSQNKNDSNDDDYNTILNQIRRMNAYGN